MKTYVDTSVLVALYVPERYSVAARREVATVPRLPFTGLHAFELRTAFELLVGRGQLTVVERDAVVGQVEDDRRGGRLAWRVADWGAAFERALSLAAAHSSATLARSLDVLHVACAAELGCERFVTADRRQAALASRIGLHAKDITGGRGIAR